jgi:hypothetical protein
MQYNPNITAVVNLAAAETNPSAIAACSTITQHALVIAGANDCITPPTTNQLAMYNALSSNCKVYVNITGASHCQFANNNFNCSFGELTCTPAPAISRAAQHSIVNSVLIPWLKFELENDCTAGLAFELLVTNPSGFTAQKNCYFCTVSGNASSDPFQELTVFPSISQGTFQVRNQSLDRVSIRATAADGRSIAVSKKAHGTSEVLLELQNAASGIYFLHFAVADGFKTIRKVVVTH